MPDSATCVERVGEGGVPDSVGGRERSRADCFDDVLAAVAAGSRVVEAAGRVAAATAGGTATGEEAPREVDKRFLAVPAA